jgi:hypothetical protein
MRPETAQAVGAGCAWPITVAIDTAAAHHSAVRRRR